MKSCCFSRRAVANTPLGSVSCDNLVSVAFPPLRAAKNSLGTIVTRCDNQSRMSLFTAGTLRSILNNHRERMIAAIDAHNANALLNTPEDTVTDYFVSEYEVDPLVIAAREDVTVEVVPTKVDARYLSNRAVWDRGSPVPVDGTLVRVRVPFTGDPILLGLQASTWSLNPPQGEISGNTVVFER